MSKLRVAKPRETVKEVENDLRGLGETSLFTNDLTPEPTLTVSRSSLSFADLASKLSLQELEATNANGHHNIVCTNKNLTHKEKAINLFAFALNLRVIANTECILWEQLRLHQELLSATGSHNAERAKGNPVPKALTLSQGIQLHLHQAGFAIQVRDEDQTLSEQQVRDLYRDILSTAKNRNRKVS